MGMSDLLKFKKVGASTAIQLTELMNRERVTIKMDDALVEVDATTSESHNFTSTLTKFPVENGAQIVDHIIKNPDTLSMTCVFSDNPVEFLDVSGLIYKFIQDSDKRSVAMFEFLKKQKENGTLFKVFTNLYEYEDMVLTSISTNVNFSNYNGLVVDLTFENVLLVDPDVVTLEGSDEAATDRINSKNEGRKTTKTADSATASTAESDLSKLTGTGQVRR